MNKISKKIVALVTMAAFVLTLVPAAAFAADAVNPTDNLPVDTNLIFATVDEQTEAVQVGDEVAAQFQVLNDNGVGVNTPSDPGVKLWAIDNETKQVTDAVTFALNATDGRKIVRTGGNANVWKVVANDSTTDAGVYNYDKVTVTFSKAGDYTLFAGYGNVAANSNNAEALKGITSLAKSVSGYQVVSVANDINVDSITLSDKNGNPLTFDSTDTATLKLTDSTVRDDFDFNGSDVYTLTGVAYDADNHVAQNKTLNFSSNKDNVVEFVKDSVQTNNKGEFKIEFSMQDKTNTTLTISDENGLNYTVRVIAATTGAYNIDRTEENGYVLATTDTDNWTGSSVTLEDAVQFKITDEKGNPVTGQDAISDEPAATYGEGNIRVMSKASKSTLTADDIRLVATGDAYTLEIKGTKGSNVLTPGKYTVRVALASDDNATVSFTAAEFGKVTDLELTMSAYDRSSGRTVDVTDEVTLGQYVNVGAKYVDENGLKITATDVTIGAYGKALVDDVTASGALKFTTKDDIAANESLLGTVVTVNAFNAANKQSVTKELTVVDSYNTFSLDFDPVQGPINEDNKVTVTVNKEDGSKAQVYGEIVGAYVADQSNEDAKVSVDIANNNVEAGKASFTVYADAETSADIVVAIKDASNDGLYAGTLEYTFGKEDPLANRTVVMTIGSTDYVVNNNIVTGDAAPYVNSDYRTMVPIRALAEAFDAEVKYDNDARTVTINFDGDTQIVMTIGEETYTVNGEEQTMDTAPIIGEGDRTYVPIRFAAEAMGFSVTPLYDADTHLTASVVFQK